MRTGLLSIVIPVYNESHHIASTVEHISKVVSSKRIAFEIIIIDDGSRDDTWQVLSNLSRTDSHLHAIQLVRHFGKAGAIRAGLDTVQGDCCIVMNCKGKVPPKYLLQMYTLWSRQQFDIVEGRESTREEESHASNWWKKVLKRCYSLILDIDRIENSEFRLMDKKVVQAWLTFPDKHTFFKGLSGWLGFSTTELYFEVQPSTAHHSGGSFLKLAKHAGQAISSIMTIPLQIVTLLGFVYLGIGAMLLIQTFLVNPIGRAGDEFTLIIILLLTIGSMMMISLGVMSVYLAKLYEEVKGTPRYLIQDTIQAGIHILNPRYKGGKI